LRHRAYNALWLRLQQGAHQAEGDDLVVVVVHEDVGDGREVALEDGLLLAGERVEQADGLVGAAGRKHAVQRRPGARVDALRVALHPHERCPAPQTHCGEWTVESVSRRCRGTAGGLESLEFKLWIHSFAPGSGSNGAVWGTLSTLSSKAAQ